MRATVENMEKAHKEHGNRVFAYSPTTQERYSAHPGDYWNAPKDWCMTDENGEDMILVYERTEIFDVL